MLSEHYTYWLLQTLAMLLTAFVLPGLRVTSIFGALITVLLLGFVNATVWDAALFFQLPDSVTSHTLLLLASNAVLFWLLVKVVPGVEIEGIVAPLVAPVLFTLFSLLIHQHMKDIDWSQAINKGISHLENFRDTLIRGQLGSEQTYYLPREVAPQQLVVEQQIAYPYPLIKS